MVHVIVDELIHSALKMGDCDPHFSVIVVPLMRGIILGNWTKANKHWDFYRLIFSVIDWYCYQSTMFQRDSSRHKACWSYCILVRCMAVMNDVFLWSLSHQLSIYRRHFCDIRVLQRSYVTPRGRGCQRKATLLIAWSFNRSVTHISANSPGQDMFSMASYKTWTHGRCEWRHWHYKC